MVYTVVNVGISHNNNASMCLIPLYEITISMQLSFLLRHTYHMCLPYITLIT